MDPCCRRCRRRHALSTRILTNAVAVADDRPLGGCLPHLVIEHAQGIKVGVIGLIESEWLEGIKCLPAATVKYTDFVQAARATASRLRREEGCAVVVALTSAHGDAARAATTPGEVIGQVAGSLRAELVREERAVVDEVLKDEQIGLDVIRESKTAGEMLDLFVEKEPPLALFLVAMLLVNGSFGLVYTLFIRETSAGPGGEFGKGVVAVRQSIVKGIFAFFNSALGRYTTKDSQDA